MSDNVVDFPGETTLDLDPDRILEEAKGKLEGVIILGYTKEEQIEFFASSYADSFTVLWLIERFKRELLKVGEE